MKNDLNRIRKGVIKIVKIKTKQVATKIEEVVTEIEYKAIAAIDKVANKVKKEVRTKAAAAKVWIKENELMVSTVLSWLFMALIGFLFGGAIVGTMARNNAIKFYTV